MFSLLRAALRLFFFFLPFYVAPSGRLSWCKQYRARTDWWGLNTDSTSKTLAVQAASFIHGQVNLAALLVWNSSSHCGPTSPSGTTAVHAGTYDVTVKAIYLSMLLLGAKSTKSWSFMWAVMPKVGRRGFWSCNSMIGCTTTMSGAGSTGSQSSVVDHELSVTARPHFFWA